MAKWYWARRFTVAFGMASCVLCLIQHLKGSTWLDASMFGLLWGGVFAALFTAIGYVRFRRNPACMLPSNKNQGGIER